MHQVIEGNYDEDYIGGRIFGSSHGMIRAMADPVMPPLPPAGECVFAEIALGEGTKKVSSCVPCAIFMQSFGYPASSIHLGRGDNWRIPDKVNEGILGKWRGNVCSYFDAGIEALITKKGEHSLPVSRLHVKPDGTLCELTSLDEKLPTFDRYIKQEIVRGSNYSAEIPEIFLEALTFEYSFTKRIINTFKAINVIKEE